MKIAKGVSVALLVASVSQGSVWADVDRVDDRRTPSQSTSETATEASPAPSQVPVYPHEHPDGSSDEPASGLENPHFDTLPGEAPVRRGVTDPADPARPTTPLEPGAPSR